MKYKVIGWRILVKPDDLDEILQENVPEFLRDKDFKVVLPEKMEKMVERATVAGTVVDVGDWAFKAYFRSTNGESFECPVKVNDRVTYAKYAGQPWVDPETEEKYVLLNDEDIHLVAPKEI